LDTKVKKKPLDEENKEVGEELDAIESNLVNNIVPKYEERVNHLEEIPNFSFGFVPRKTTSYEEISLTPISQTGYILNIGEARNKEDIF